MGAIIMEEEKIFTVKEVAEILRINHKTVRKMIQDGELAAFVVRGEYRIRKSSLDAVIQRKLPPTTDKMNAVRLDVQPEEM